MHWSRILGVGLLVAGVLRLFMGWNASESLTEDIHETLTGRLTDETTRYLIGGGLAAAAWRGAVTCGPPQLSDEH